MILLAFLAATSGVACKVDHARYVLRADPSVTLHYHAVPKTADWWAGLAVELRLAKTGRVSWWLPTFGGSSDRREFAWTTLKRSPQGLPGYSYKLHRLQYFAFDRNYGMLNATAVRGDEAPAHIFLTDLREAFWYADDPATRSSPPQSLFDLVGCDSSEVTPDIVFPEVP